MNNVNKLGSADFSPCRRYRYTLWRQWRHGCGYVQFIGLNPSTADEYQNDPTVTRCINYAKRWGYSGMCMTNIFAYRATDPEEMKRYFDPVGPDNDLHLMDVSECARIIIAAWGVHGVHKIRGENVAMMFPNLHCLKTTKDGHPSHPLYLRADLKPIPYKVVF